MGKNSLIEWTDHTFNPWIGCQHVSPACDHCYAEAYAKRTGQGKLWGPSERRRTSLPNWRQPVRWNTEARALVVQRRVFCASLADVFDNAVPPEWRRDLFALIGSTTYLDWLLLTKRIGNAAAMLQQATSEWHGWRFPWSNVWLGATVVNQDEADRDIPKLLATGAARRFLSIEPLLGPVNVGPYLSRTNMPGFNLMPGFKDPLPGVDWVIVGGESGSQARPMHPDWVRSIRDQCTAAGVAFLFKQWGEWLPATERLAQNFTVEHESAVHNWDNTSPDGYSIRVGKKQAGRLLDGRDHTEFPSSAVQP